MKRYTKVSEYSLHPYPQVSYPAQGDSQTILWDEAAVVAWAYRNPRRVRGTVPLCK